MTLLFTLLLQANPAIAAQQPGIEDKVSQEMVRRRQYPGGKDEDDLVVQQNSQPISRKLDERSIQMQVLKGVKFGSGTPSEDPAAEE